MYSQRKASESGNLFTPDQAAKLNKLRNRDKERYAIMYKYYSAVNSDLRVGRVLSMDGTVIYPGVEVKGGDK